MLNIKFIDMKRLLLLSNSTNAGESYLEYPRENIKSFLEDITEAIFVPYAAVNFGYEVYESKVNESLNKVGVHVKSIHHFANPVSAIQRAKAIIIGGGNTFKLGHHLHEYNLIEAIKDSVEKGTPYIGWSAGSNVACPTLCTTNDMPIIEPKSFKTLHLIPFQINPHYMHENPEGFAGETRQQRIEEFLHVNPTIDVVGLREGTMLKVEGDKIELVGKEQCRIFEPSKLPYELSNTDNFNFLIK